MAAHFCPHCKVYATFANLGPNSVWKEHTHTLWQCHNCSGIVYVQLTQSNGELSSMHPHLRSEASSDLPDDVRDNLDEAIRPLNAANPKAAVVMIRSALQACMRQQSAQGSNLRHEIDYLADQHVIPRSLKEWAHEIRNGGNLVAHPEPGTKVEPGDALELLELAESIFDYLYVVPAEVTRRRARISAEDQGE